jgi:hypothetical protein
MAILFINKLTYISNSNYLYALLSMPMQLAQIDFTCANYSGKPLNPLAFKPALSQLASSDVNIFACGFKSGSSLSEPAGIINVVLPLFMKGSPEPQMEQNDFENPLVG